MELSEDDTFSVFYTLTLRTKSHHSPERTYRLVKRLFLPAKFSEGSLADQQCSMLLSFECRINSYPVNLSGSA